MRRKPLILLAFLLVLYIAPLFFTMSYGSSTIPAEQNTTKDFALSEDWYNEDFHYRQKITIDGGEVATETDYQVLVNATYDSDMQNDFDDIRFTDADKVTGLDYWLESYTVSAFAIFWVEVSEAIAKGIEHDGELTYIYMYYGNAEASTTSNGTATFVFFEDWTTESFLAEKWDLNTGDGSTSFDDTDALHGSVLKLEGGVGTAKQVYDSDDSFDTDFALRFRSNVGLTAAHAQITQIGWGDVGSSAFQLFRSYREDKGQIISNDDDANLESDTVADGYFNSYRVIDLTRDGTNSKLYIDNVLEETQSLAPDVNEFHINIYCRDTEADLYSDWFVVRSFVADEPEVTVFGEEESNLSPEWELISSVEIIIIIGVYTGGLNALVILLGIIMIPASTLYLVKGGKDEMSKDKIFYGLIAFILGWGFLLGGVG